MEFGNRSEYHDQLLKLNTGRNAFEYILQAKKYQLVYLPWFTCDVLMEPIKRAGVKYAFYHIDEALDPIIDFTINADECFLYINYFGVKNDTVERLATQIDNLVIDNSQAFFSKPIGKTNTFYSCRKFFGVPDGAYLNIGTENVPQFPQDVSYERCTHLLKCIDHSIEDGYSDFLANEALLAGEGIKQMSVLTQKIMSSVDYVFCREQRNKNFFYLHERLRNINEIKLNFKSADGPLCYPLLVSGRPLRQQLNTERIYIADFWPNVRRAMAEEEYEHFLALNLAALPVDHRYDEKDMDHIIETVNKLTRQ